MTHMSSSKGHRLASLSRDQKQALCACGVFLEDLPGVTAISRYADHLDSERKLVGRPDVLAALKAMEGCGMTLDRSTLPDPIWTGMTEEEITALYTAGSFLVYPED